MMGTIGRTATMAGDFPAHRRGCSTEATGDLTERRARSDPSRDILSLSERECQPRAATSAGRDPATGQQHFSNRVMPLAVDTPNFMQCLPSLPTFPDVDLLARRKSRPLPLDHKHHL